MLKKCRVCKKPRKIEEYAKVRRAFKVYRRGNCNTCRRKTEANRALKSAYGVDLTQKKKMYEKQRGLCGACGLPLSKNYRKAHLDHSHKTGRIRELLHATCNWLMGQEEASPGVLEKVSAYRKKWLDNDSSI